MNLVLFAFALVAFVLAALKVQVGGCEMLPVGMIFLTIGFIFGGWPPTWWKPPG